MLEKTLGILELDNEPIKQPGFLAGPGTFQFPVKRMKVLGATTRKVVDSDKSVRKNYIDSARRLEGEGVAAIIANCGFAGLFQSEVAAAVSVPVALSSLLLVPFIIKTLPAGCKVGLLTYDAQKLTEDHFAAAGWSSTQMHVPVVGIEGSDSWRRLAQPNPEVDPSELVKDVVSAAKRLLKAESNVRALVSECTGFPIASEAVRRETGVPVADCTVLARMLMEMSPPRDSP